ncbi:MAG: hypothetical protein K1X82_03235 [Bacteroidia bacterium]|nr:hypothetical protein [Bacteroidia bacterium]
MFKKNWIGLAGLLVVITIQMALYGFPKLLKQGPASIHQWRQCDCLAMTQMYYEYNNPFLDPELLFLGPGGNGKCTPSEFPIIYYSVAQAWKVFGKSETIYRLLDLAFMVMALIALFYLFKLYIPNQWLAIGLTALVFTSPILVFYGVSFLSDPSALFMAIVGSSLFFYYLHHRSWTYLLASALFFSIAGWFKISAAAAYAAISLLLFTDLIRLSNFGLWPKNQVLKMMAIWAIPVLAWLPWYGYAYYRGLIVTQGKMEFFLIGILPIWKMDKDWIWSTIGLCISDIKPQVFHRSVLLLLVFGQLFTFFFYRYSNKLLFWLSNVFVLLFVVYVLLFFQVFNVHDYYFVNMMVVPIFLLLNISVTLYHAIQTVEVKRFALVLFSILLVFNVYYCSAKMSARVRSPKGKTLYSYALTPREKAFWDWFHWDQEQHMGKLKTLKDKLPGLGIPKEEPVVVMGDISINVSLYLLEKRGFTDFMIGERRNNIDVTKFKHIIFLYDQAKENDVIKPYIGEEIYRDGELSICKTKPAE